MPSGFETYVNGTTDIQLSNTNIYFSLSQKGIIPAPTQWFNPKGSSQDTGYFYCEVDIAYTKKEYPILVVAPSRFPCKLFYSIININTNRIRILLTVSDKSVPINYLIYDTSPPNPNPSKKGLELYKEGRLVFASETAVLRPVMQGEVGLGGVLGLICNKQGWNNDYSWEEEGPGEHWISEIDSVTALEFVVKNKAQISVCQTRHSSYENSSPGGSGHTYRANEREHYTFVDITGH